MNHAGRKRMFGYIRIYIEGYSPERFLNTCAYHGITFWGLSPSEHGYEMNIALKDYRKLKPMAKKTHTRIRIKAKYGFPFFLARVKQRKIFFAGAVICIFLLKLYSMFIWDIHFEGNCMRTDEALAEFLKSTDVYPLMLKKNVDCQGIVKNIRKEYNDIVWVSASIDGTRLLIQIKENDDDSLSDNRTESGKEIPTDLIASSDGVITGIVTRSGIPQVHIGDSVKKGETLVLGRIDVTSDNGEVIGYRYQKSDADIFADTKLEYHDRISLNYQDKKYTGKEKCEFFVRIGQWKVKFGSVVNNDQNCEIYSEQNIIRIGENLILPIVWGKKNAKEYVNVDKTYQEDEIRRILSERFERFCDDLEEKDVQIIKNNVKIQLYENSAAAAGTVYMNERITQEKETEILTMERKETDESVGTDN